MGRRASGGRMNVLKMKKCIVYYHVVRNEIFTLNSFTWSNWTDCWLLCIDNGGESEEVLAFNEQYNPRIIKIGDL